MINPSLLPPTSAIEPADLQMILAAWTEATDRLQHTHELLQDEVRRLTNELEQKNKELARRNRLADLGQMASHIAHEVRNGLLPIKLYLSLLRRCTTENPQALELLQKMTSGVAGLEVTTNDLLHFSADRDARTSSVACRSLCQEVVESLDLQISSQEIRVSIQADPELQVEADPEMLRRALFNLMLNALDVLPNGGEVLLQATTTDAQWQIEVSDNGPGIPSELLPRLFDPFFTTKATGTGLGLAIVERIAQAHRGKLLAENNPSGGARFVLCLPRPTVARSPVPTSDSFQTPRTFQIEKEAA